MNDSAIEKICARLQIDDRRNVEIESKKRVLPKDVKKLKDYLLNRKGVHHVKKRVFFDQFLDTPGLALLKSHSSLRLRYKGDGSQVYLQYKGPGFHRDGLLYRSEFSSQQLEHVVREESHHDMVHFNDTSVRKILASHADPSMARAMRLHLGDKIISKITTGPILCLYQKDKFVVDLGSAFLEPSLDRLFAFHINRSGLHSLSTFCEYENEIKAEKGALKDKLEHLDDLIKFDKEISKRFDLRPERLDKYHRCASCFM